MDTYVLFWRSLFDLAPEQHWESADPRGLIQSRAMLSGNRKLRLSLNISESRDTTLGRFVSSYAGAGVHHIAFSTKDIMRTLGQLLPAAPMLPIPWNYYEDLAARWGLEDEQLGELQRLGLLYDRDEHGEFFHAYTDTFDERFFFEVIQRRGYQGFGAVNAAVRMAAQAKRTAAQATAQAAVQATSEAASRARG